MKITKNWDEVAKWLHALIEEVMAEVKFVSKR